jgi:hypothetical protein
MQAATTLKANKPATRAASHAARRARELFSQDAHRLRAGELFIIRSS